MRRSGSLWFHSDDTPPETAAQKPEQWGMNTGYPARLDHSGLRRFANGFRKTGERFTFGGAGIDWLNPFRGPIA